MRDTPAPNTARGAPRLDPPLYVGAFDRLDLPDDDETRTEFTTTRLVEIGPGVVKIQNPPGTHDDIVTAVGMVVADLTERPDVGRGSVTVPTGRAPIRTLRDARPAASGRRAVIQAARRGPRGLPGGAVQGTPGAYDDPASAATHGIGDAVSGFTCGPVRRCLPCMAWDS